MCHIEIGAPCCCRIPANVTKLFDVVILSWFTLVVHVYCIVTSKNMFTCTVWQSHKHDVTNTYWFKLLKAVTLLFEVCLESKPLRMYMEFKADTTNIHVKTFGPRQVCRLYLWWWRVDIRSLPQSANLNGIHSTKNIHRETIGPSLVC